MQASARDFLWRHWLEHRLGQLVTVKFTPEGLPTRTTLYVEPDSAHRWRIVLEYRTALPGIKPDSNEHFEELTTKIASSIERAEVRPDGTASEKAIRPDDIRDAMSYRLILKDKDGKIVGER
jgi:hypothetical protein